MDVTQNSNTDTLCNTTSKIPEKPSKNEYKPAQIYTLEVLSKATM